MSRISSLIKTSNCWERDVLGQNLVPGGGIGQPEGAREAKKRMKKSFHFIIEHSREKKYNWEPF